MFLARSFSIFSFLCTHIIGRLTVAAIGPTRKY